MPQIATVGLVGGLRANGAIGTQEEPAVFRRNTKGLRGLVQGSYTQRYNSRHEIFGHLFAASGTISTRCTPVVGHELAILTLETQPPLVGGEHGWGRHLGRLAT
ncbi:MAG: hypothetical protein NT154_05850 [Verrucomicrobia bacterium]|nr:hypothetical protein [Verrucomicrobiota bacterium]